MARVSLLSAAVGAAAVAAFVLGFALARATGTAHAGRSPVIRELHAAGGGVSLPHLSDAAPLPALARRAPVVRAAPVANPASAPPKPSPAPPKPSRPKRAQHVEPVVIVGSG
jgi:hypothetical protein